MASFTPDLGERFARIALGHVSREFPNKLDHVMTGPEDARSPRDLHPLFYGSFDWHSCVHAWWMLATLIRQFPNIESAPAIKAHFASHLTPDAVAAECAYLDRPLSRGFERPYGWAWLLKLAGELGLHDAPWARTIRPLAERFSDRFRAFLPLATYPIRHGVHTNTAFALRLALDYRDTTLHPLLHEAAIRWYGRDRDCQAWEPSGDEFLSPALMEAACMRTVLSKAEFRIWFSGFFPRLAEGEPATLFLPATVSDRSDGKIAHLDGLNFSRAWCWRAVAAFAPDPAAIEAAALAHIDASLPHIAGDYMGEHWLASFAVLALSS